MDIGLIAEGHDVHGCPYPRDVPSTNNDCMGEIYS
jgi:hypothetical protein